MTFIDNFEEYFINGIKFRNINIKFNKIFARRNK